MKSNKFIKNFEYFAVFLNFEEMDNGKMEIVNKCKLKINPTKKINNPGFLED